MGFVKFHQFCFQFACKFLLKYSALIKIQQGTSDFMITKVYGANTLIASHRQESTGAQTLKVVRKISPTYIYTNCLLKIHTYITLNLNLTINHIEVKLSFEVYFLRFYRQYYMIIGFLSFRWVSVLFCSNFIFA